MPRLSKAICEYLAEYYEPEWCGHVRIPYEFQAMDNEKIYLFFDEGEMRVRPEWDFEAPWSIDYADPILFDKLHEAMDELGAVKRGAYDVK